MKGGQNRLPRNVKALRGTLRPHRERLDAPAPPPSGGMPAPPAGLSAARRAVALELWPQVEVLGVCSASDATAFWLMVDAVHAARVAAKDPGCAPSALAAVLRAASSALQGFGLSPASRDRVPRAQAQSPVARLLAGIGGGR
jgi:hypothetical protein